MNRYIISQLLIGMWVAILFGCTTLQKQSINEEGSTKIESVAIVSFAVNNYGNKLNYSGNIHTSRHIADNMIVLVDHFEQKLGERLRIMPVQNIIKNPQYIEMGNKKEKRGRFWQGVIRPILNNQVMQVFTTKRKALVRCVLDPGTVQKLCRVLGVDALVLFYSEWHVATGRYVPTNKALTKNLMAMYNSNGNRVFFDRKDVMGKRVLGAEMHFHLDENTIQEWVKTTNQGVDFMVQNIGFELN